VQAEVGIQLSREEAGKAVAAKQFPIGLRNGLRQPRVIAGIAIYAAYACFAWINGDTTAQVALVVVTAVTLACCLWYYTITRMWWRRQFCVPYRVRLSEEGLAVDSTASGTRRWTWDQVTSIQHRDGLTVFFVQSRLWSDLKFAAAVPDRVVSGRSGSEFEEFMAALQPHISQNSHPGEHRE
jgi:hypothetical protein